MKAKSCIIYEPLFNVDVYVQRGGKINDCIKRYAKKLKVEAWTVEDNDSRMGHFTNIIGHKSGCIWLNEKAGLGTVAHECFHAVCEILKRSGLKLNAHTEEIYAYYLQFLINTILKKLYGWK